MISDAEALRQKGMHHQEVVGVRGAQTEKIGQQPTRGALEEQTGDKIGDCPTTTPGGQDADKARCQNWRRWFIMLSRCDRKASETIIRRVFVNPLNIGTCKEAPGEEAIDSAISHFTGPLTGEETKNEASNRRRANIPQ